MKKLLLPIFITILFSSFFISVVLATDRECTPPYSGYVGSYPTQSACAAEASVCVQSGATWAGYNSTKVGNSCTLDASGSSGTCNTIGECILLGECDPVWREQTSWAPLESTKTCGMSFVQTRELYDASNCGTNAGKPAVSQTAVGTFCSQGKTCQNNNCVTVSGGGTTQPVTPPTTGSACPAGQICNPLGYDTFEAILGAITKFIFNVGMVLAPVMLIIAGFFFVTAAGDPKRVETGKQIIKYTLIGLAVLLLAKGLIKVLESILGYQG